MKQFIIALFSIVPLLLLSQNDKINGILLEYEGKKFESIIKKFNQNRQNITSWEYIGPNTNTYFITGNDLKSIFEDIENEPGIVAIQYSHETEQRKKPNDPRQSEQYYLNIIKAFDAWDFTTGGTTFDGKDIVIAVIDDGFDIGHEDLKANIYTNPDEIPNDGIDNDNNGYIDDVNGWNLRNNTGTLDIKSHGTNVIGMLGASGNNGLGISSVNWNIKILPINIATNEGDVVKAYEFMLSEKNKYLTSGGTKGANILISNYSGGIEKAFEKDHLVWCNLYNKLGSAGILSVAATTNENEDVDKLGDIPSNCSSPYLLIVNSTDKTDEKTKNTGYGSVSVDISAPGEKILTTFPTLQGVYKEASGTSLATPIVAAAAALLHSAGCESFQNLLKNAPASAVLAIKDALMQSVDKKSSLSGKTVSGGRINIFKALQLFVKDNCEIITHEMNVGKIIQNGVNSFDVTFKIDVSNKGSKDGMYTLNDNTVFDDDITINNGKFISNVTGIEERLLNGKGPWELANDQLILASEIHTYNIILNVSLDLSDGSAGNNIYSSCGLGNTGSKIPGQGLFKRSTLDNNGDGIPDEVNEVCGEFELIGTLTIKQVQIIQNDLFVEYQTLNQNEITATIFDTSGKLLWVQKFTQPIFGERVLQINFIPDITGIYFISLISDSDVASKRFLR